MNEVAPREYKHTLFGDLDATWTVSKRIKLTARLANLWGQTAYQVTRLSATDISSFAVPLRPRELIVTATLRIHLRPTARYEKACCGALFRYRECRF